jgi:Ca2+-transporting ATPase
VPRTEFFDDVDPAPFAFEPYKLASMLDPKDVGALAEFGGSRGFLSGLGMSGRYGLRNA